MTTTTMNEQIRDLGERWARAEPAGDVDRLAGLVTDVFRLVGPFGFVLDKTQWLDRYRSGDFVTTELSWHDVETRTYGETAVAIGTQTQQAAYKGTPSNGDFRTNPHLRPRRRRLGDRQRPTQPRLAPNDREIARPVDRVPCRSPRR